jgi:hypothetical protein
MNVAIDEFDDLRNSNINIETMSAPCKLRRSTQYCFDCRWCGSSRQDYDNTFCDICGVKYSLRLFFESFGHDSIRVFGDFAKDKEWVDTLNNMVVFDKLFGPLGGKNDKVSLGWVFKKQKDCKLDFIRHNLLKLGINNWYTISELSSRIHYESGIGVDI